MGFVYIFRLNHVGLNSLCISTEKNVVVLLFEVKNISYILIRYLIFILLSFLYDLSIISYIIDIGDIKQKYF